jgi:hypothetical protein
MKRVSAAAAPATPPPYFPREASLLAYGIQFRRKYEAHKVSFSQNTEKD